MVRTHQPLEAVEVGWAAATWSHAPSGRAYCPDNEGPPGTEVDTGVPGDDVTRPRRKGAVVGQLVGTLDGHGA